MEVEEVYKKGRSSTPGVCVMKLATLVFITRSRGDVEEILLARKKTGEIGIGALSAPGGKIEPGEHPPITCTREVWEEMLITIPNSPEMLKEVALLDVFRAQDNDAYEHFMRIFVYVGRAFSGEPSETKDMERPFWVPFDKIPYDEMYPGDDRWMPYVLAGEPNKLHFTIYRHNGEFVKILTEPLRPFIELMAT